MHNILGISLGTRLLGMAVVFDGELCEYRVRTFYGAWTEEKRQEMLRTIKKTAAQYGVSSIVVKTPKPSHSSQSIHALLSDLRQLGEDQSITVTICTISVLKGPYNGPGRGNKQTLMQAILEKYPEHRQLRELYARERNNHSAYHVKLFEAIACTELA